MNDLLDIQGISVAYGAVKAVTDLNFTMREGEILGLIGPNGAGKTTAVNLISCTAIPQQGKVRLFGNDVTGIATHKLVALGLVRTFQSTNVYREQTVRENVLRGAFGECYTGFWSTFFNTRKHREAQELAVVKASQVMDDLGLGALGDVEARNLAYGQQKALGIAIALASNPKLILLDEPAAGLSAEEADRVADVVRKVNERGVSVIVIDHNMRFIANICHRVVVMNQGTVLCSGSPSEVTANPAVIEAYLGSDHVAA